MCKWNKTHNLTRITDLKSAAEKHYLDSLVGFQFIPEDRVVHDLGSGAGFPGLVGAILRPAQEFVLVEPARKRASFLERTAKACKLTNLRVVNDRAQALSNVDLVISRGTFSWPNWAPLAESLGEAGEFFMWLGHTPGADLFQESLHAKNFTSAWFSYELPTSGTRHIGRGKKI